jgi:cob(I)alamin adenosyltransferase
MKIYTKRGDKGETDLFGGQRVLKNHIRVKAYGDIDCANSAIGLAVSAADINGECKDALMAIMKLLFVAGAEIATASKEKSQILLDKHLKNRLNNNHVLYLEHAIDEMESQLQPLKNFILPCGTDTSARLHFARNMVRKAEISLIDLWEHGDFVREEIIQFFNRLSDYLFVMARFANAKAEVEDVLWCGSLEE